MTAKAVMKEVLKNCKKVEDDCEILYLKKQRKRPRDYRRMPGV